MNDSGRRLAAAGFHSGEVAVQQRAGVHAEASRLARMVAPGELRAGVAAFLTDATFAAITARDSSGRLWTSPLLGPPGFLQVAEPTVLRVNMVISEADPLGVVGAGQPAGLIVMDFATRRRVRINGLLSDVTADGLTVDVDQVYGNCPQYITRRSISGQDASPGRVLDYRGSTLRRKDIQMIEAADTFFLGSTHPTSGNDASHRGGPTGFVHATPDHLWWPDFPGNNMFNSLGNVAVDPTAALLFVDFDTGSALHLSGTAAMTWDAQEPEDNSDTGRRVQFVPELVVCTSMAK